MHICIYKPDLNVLGTNSFKISISGILKTSVKQKYEIIQFIYYQHVLNVQASLKLQNKDMRG